MHKEKFVFAQLAEFLDGDKFCHIVDKYDENSYVKSFTCWNQLLVMMFGQLSNRKSLRDLALVITPHSDKCYHLGFGKAVKWKLRMPANVISDSIIRLSGYASEKKYPDVLRRVVYYDEEQDRTFTFLTNALTLDALTIALLYKNQWQIPPQQIQLQQCQRTNRK